MHPLVWRLTGSGSWKRLIGARILQSISRPRLGVLKLNFCGVQWYLFGKTGLWETSILDNGGSERLLSSCFSVALYLSCFGSSSEFLVLQWLLAAFSFVHFFFYLFARFMNDGKFFRSCLASGWYAYYSASCTSRFYRSIRLSDAWNLWTRGTITINRSGYLGVNPRMTRIT